MRAVTAYRPSSRRPVRGSARVSSIATILRLFCLSGVLIMVSPEPRGGSKWSLRRLPRPVRHIIWDRPQRRYRAGPVRARRNLAGMTESGRVVVAGAGLAGVPTVEELRERGFAGPITLVGAEPRPPADRPPLTKEFVAGPGLDPPLTADFARLEADSRPLE